MTQTAKKRPRFSIVDFVIIILFLAFIVSIFARYDLIRKLFPGTSRLSADITVTAESISPEEAKRLKSGSVLYLDGDPFGTVKSVNSVNAITYSEDHLGVLKTKEDPALRDVTVVVSSKVSSSDNGYLLNGEKFVSAGSEFVVDFDSVSVKITVLSIKINE